MQLTDLAVVAHGTETENSLSCLYHRNEADNQNANFMSGSTNSLLMTSTSAKIRRKRLEGERKYISSNKSRLLRMIT